MKLLHISHQHKSTVKSASKAQIKSGKSVANPFNNIRRDINSEGDTSSLEITHSIQNETLDYPHKEEIHKTEDAITLSQNSPQHKDNIHNNGLIEQQNPEVQNETKSHVDLSTNTPIHIKDALEQPASSEELSKNLSTKT